MNARLRLPRKALDYLDLRDEKNDPWATACSIATYCLNVGLTEADFHDLMVTSDFIEVFDQDQRATRREQKLSECWSKVEDAWEPPIGGKDEIRKGMAALHSRLQGHVFPGRGRATDRKVALAVVEQCHQDGSVTPMLSARHVSRLVSVSASTAGKSVSRLTEQGLFSPVDNSDVRVGAAKHRVNLRFLEGRTRTSKSVPGIRITCTGMAPSPDHPAFHARALGPNAGRIFFEVTEPSTATEISRSLGIPLTTVKRNLRRLFDNGAVTKDGSRYLPNDDADLDAIAAHPGYDTIDVAARLMERHQRDRKGYDEVLRQRGELWRLPENQGLTPVVLSPSVGDPFADDYVPAVFA